MTHNLDPLNALSPLDGRYRTVAGRLTAYMSEECLIRGRVIVETDYLRMLGAEGIVPISKDEDALLQSWNDLSHEDAVAIKVFEAETNHDVKAVEYYLKKKAAGTSLEKKMEWFHFALTSDDVNSIAYGFVLRGAIANELIPALAKIETALDAMAVAHAGTPMLARTHGQPASPTTFGKEMRVFAARLKRQVDQLSHIPIPVKFSGATGTYAAHVAAFPNVDWISFAERFIDRYFNAPKAEMRFVLTRATTQIESHDGYAEMFDNLRRINVILLDFSQDMWRYISDGWVVQAQKDGEVGSSTMPHKVNPIDFENAEGNLGIANALLTHFSNKLPISRLQRDLSDSTVERAFGEAFGHALVAYEALLKGLGKISVNVKAMDEALDAHPEVLAEAIQTILRREGVADAYELLKNLTRGEAVTMKSLHVFINTLPISDTVKSELKQLTPQSYIGLAAKIARVGGNVIMH